MTKAGLMAASIASVLAMTSAPVMAQNFSLGIGPNGVVVEPQRELRRDPRWRDDRGFDDRRVIRGITCRDGARIVRQQGYRDVQPTECAGRVLTYTARAGRGFVEVRIASATGEIIEVSRL